MLQKSLLEQAQSIVNKYLDGETDDNLILGFVYYIFAEMADTVLLDSGFANLLKNSAYLVMALQDETICSRLKEITPPDQTVSNFMQKRSIPFLNP